jgi:hypothetical protein
MNANFISTLGSLKDKPIRLYYYSPPNASSSRETSYMWVGNIKNVDSEGFLTFEHIPTEAKRLQCKSSFLNLSACVIMAIDELADDYDRSTAFPCPHCGGIVALEETLGEHDELIGLDDLELEDEGVCSSSTSIV